ncbi:transposase [Acinetobacter sp. TR3]|nr:transposase [Acinetobacter sp. TR3]WAU76787.1 transposase [Acinetobacter sp. TR3]
MIELIIRTFIPKYKQHAHRFAWFERCLAFRLQYANQPYKRADTQALLEQQGHQILWLPAYSPDLNPIEKMWAWVKRKRKEWLVDSIDQLFRLFFNKCMNN